MKRTKENEELFCFMKSKMYDEKLMDTKADLSGHASVGNMNMGFLCDQLLKTYDIKLKENENG
jgi:hypothetical protein